MRFSIFSLSIFLHSQNFQWFAIPTKKRKEIFEFKKFHFSKWLTPQLKTFLLRKGAVQIGRKGVDSLSKRLIYVLFIEIQVQIVLFLEVPEAGRFTRSKMQYRISVSVNGCAFLVCRIQVSIACSRNLCISVSRNECPNDNINSVSPNWSKVFLVIAVKFSISCY